MENKIEFYYRAKGRVHGNHWGGGVSSFESKELRSASIDKLHQKIREGIEDGSLDDGFGYESLFGAVMEITTIRTVIIEDRTYRNEESEIELFGEPEHGLIDLDLAIIGI